MEYLVVFSSLLAVALAAEWNYADHGPEHWADDYPTCAGQNQSPINADSRTAMEKEMLLLLQGYSSAVQWTVQNNGHTVVFNVPSANAGQYVVEAADAYTGTVYRWSLAQFHIHWGKANTEGSENTISGQKYPMEVHFVHANTKYDADHGSHSDGYLVLGFMFEIGAENVAFNKIVQTLPLVRFKGAETVSDSLSPSALIAGSVETKEFFHWKGSLTTPGCNEAVSWYLFKNPIVVSAAQVNVFRNTLYENEEGQAELRMLQNWRPVQPLNSRTVYKNKVSTPTEPPSPCSGCSLTAGVLLVVPCLVMLFFRR